MDQAQTAKHFETSVKKNTNRFVVALLAATVTLMSIQPITARWHTYDWLSKFLAIVFLLTLVTKPFLDFRAETKGRQTSGLFAISLDGYILALLAIILFGGR